MAPTPHSPTSIFAASWNRCQALVSRSTPTADDPDEDRLEPFGFKARDATGPERLYARLGYP